MREGRRIKTFYQQEQTDEWIGLRVIPRGGYSGNKRVGEERKVEGILGRRKEEDVASPGKFPDSFNTYPSSFSATCK